MTEPMYLTAEGAEKLKVELAELKGPQRTALAARLRDAIQMGDLSENADYHKAKEDQAFLEGRILELEWDRPQRHCLGWDARHGARR
jgi:transcription elongation factor GreA